MEFSSRKLKIIKAVETELNIIRRRFKKYFEVRGGYIGNML